MRERRRQDRAGWGKTKPDRVDGVHTDGTEQGRVSASGRFLIFISFEIMHSSNGDVNYGEIFFFFFFFSL